MKFSRIETGNIGKTAILPKVYHNNLTIFYNSDVDKNNKNCITVIKYINDIGMKGKYYIYVKINDTIYDPNLYIQYYL